MLKERNLGTEVFGRPSDYDTSADPIVRVTAGEVRKRIAQYYQTAGHQEELRIDLPIGSYVPHFYAPGQQAKSADGPPTPELTVAPVPSVVAEEGAEATTTIVPPQAELVPRSKWWRRLGRIWTTLTYACALIGFISMAYLLAAGVRSRLRNPGSNYFWRSYTPSSDALIVVGVHFTDSSGRSMTADSRAESLISANETALAAMETADMVPVSDMVSYSKLIDVLTHRGVPYKTQTSVETTLDELRPGPVVLFGGLNNLWTLRLTSGLRYRFSSQSANLYSIEDSQHPSTKWNFDNLQPAHGNYRDYAIVASYFDKTIEQHVVVAAGVGKSGTVAATEFLASENDMKNWMAATGVRPDSNVELVLATDVLDGDPGPPHVIAYSVW
ncbi:hypothetical protein HDF16_005961 [Granulicella aggregans]|uniref:Uncharacterized protein n=1 Tax=Granulicella aggregans TaxID=474949 RepID=A0A7W7ZJU1_9BACT|nr:hypothetical protein [Granulicella aggregans]MBB5061225.1 hypothetical protein [Granulicella aggregans]